MLGYEHQDRNTEAEWEKCGHKARCCGGRQMGISRSYYLQHCRVDWDDFESKLSLLCAHFPVSFLCHLQGQLSVMWTPCLTHMHIA